MKKLFATCSLIILAACGRPVPEATSTQHLDIDVPKDDIDPQDIKELTAALNPFIIEGKSQVNFKELAAQVNVTGDFKVLFDQLVASRDDMIDVECKGRKCIATSTGSDFSFKPPVSLPVVGTPTIYLAKNIKLYAELSDDLAHLEICRIDGIRVKVSLFTQNVEGALIETETVPAKEGEEETTSIKTFKIDSGVGGSYPSTSCQF